MRPLDPTQYVYHGDPASFSLDPNQRMALRFGRITPREAELVLLNRAEGRGFWRRVENGDAEAIAQLGRQAS